ncbi:MAG: precorrin-3B C(17)-methyltransferase [Nitrosopumilus sp. H13]|nr:MAG: precorrin-3B C(17)-methyltransferase [Nitrosopumilus sp. H13]
MEKTAVLAITKNGIKMGLKLGDAFPGWKILAPAKLSDSSVRITWYDEPTPAKIAQIFKEYDAVVCLFSLGAVIRLIAPYLVDKKTDPAVIVIDDRAGFVISALSGHIGGANELARDIAKKLGAVPVITTAADVNKTMAVDLVGRDLGWVIDDDSMVTRVSAHMVNEEPIGLLQDAGKRDWCPKLPKNVTVFEGLAELDKSGSRACLVITDRMVAPAIESVIYRPPSLVVGVGLHTDTTKDTILKGIKTVLEKSKLSPKSVAILASIKKPQDVQGLADAAKELGVPAEYVNRDDLAEITTPNPSDTVRTFEGTASVSEAAAVKISGGKLVVEKQKFPPDLTIAVARIPG